MKLHQYIAAKKRLPFDYGTNDCVLFSVGWQEIRAGKKYLPETLWTSEAEAVALTKARGGLIAVFDATFTRIDPAYARDGDLTVCEGVASLFSGVHIVSVSRQGLIYKSRQDARNAWTV